MMRSRNKSPASRDASATKTAEFELRTLSRANPLQVTIVASWSLFAFLDAPLDVSGILQNRDVGLPEAVMLDGRVSPPRSNRRAATSQEAGIILDFRAPPKQRFDRIANFRDLAGHTTRDGRELPAGRLFRSGHLGNASNADRAQLESLGLCVVFDFRTASDIGVDGEDRLPPGVESVRLPMPDPAQGRGVREILEAAQPDELEAHFGGGRAEALMRGAAAGLIRERREPYGEFLRALAKSTALPALFHCSAGKDRAGWAGSLVLLTLGVPEDQVIEQYLLSNRAVEEIIAQYRGRGGEAWTDLLRPIIEVRAEYVEASLAAVREDWGSFESYLERGLGVSEAEQDAIRKHLLD